MLRGETRRFNEILLTIKNQESTIKILHETIQTKNRTIKNQESTIKILHETIQTKNRTIKEQKKLIVILKSANAELSELIIILGAGGKHEI